MRRACAPIITRNNCACCRHGKQRYRRVSLQRNSLEGAWRSFRRRSMEISNAPDVGSIKQCDLASIRSPACREGLFSDVMNAILRFRHLARIEARLFAGEQREIELEHDHVEHRKCSLVCKCEPAKPGRGHHGPKPMILFRTCPIRKLHQTMKARIKVRAAGVRDGSSVRCCRQQTQ
jgi:hypothetical protein